MLCWLFISNEPYSRPFFRFRLPPNIVHRVLHSGRSTERDLITALCSSARPNNARCDIYFRFRRLNMSLPVVRLAPPGGEWRIDECDGDKALQYSPRRRGRRRIWRRINRGSGRRRTRKKGFPATDQRTTVGGSFQVWIQFSYGVDRGG